MTMLEILEIVKLALLVVVAYFSFSTHRLMLRHHERVVGDYRKVKDLADALEHENLDLRQRLVIKTEFITNNLAVKCKTSGC